MNIDLAAWSTSASQRLRALGIGDTVAVKPPVHPRGCYVIDVDSQRVIGQFSVWPSGEAELQIGDLTKRHGDPLIRHASAADEAGLDAFFDEFVRAAIQMSRA